MKNSLTTFVSVLGALFAWQIINYSMQPTSLDIWQKKSEIRHREFLDEANKTKCEVNQMAKEQNKPIVFAEADCH